MAITERSGPRGTSFRVTYRDHQGKQRSAGTFKTDKEAKAAERRALSLRDDKIIAAPHKPVVLYAEERHGVPTLAAFVADTWLPNLTVGYHAQDTYRRVYRARIEKPLANMAMTEVRPADIKRLFQAMEGEGVTSSYISTVKTVLTSIFQAAIESGIVSSNPARDVTHKGKKNGRRASITKEQFLALLKELPEHYRLLASTIASTGLRWEECMALKDSSLSDDDYLTVDNVVVEVAEPQRFIERFGTKNGSTRRIGIDHQLAEEMRALPAGFMFTTRRGEHISGNVFRSKVWRPAVKRAGLPSTLVPRDLRRVHATWARDGGASLEAIRDRLGHGNVSITDIYLGTNDSGDAEVLSALGEIPTVHQPIKKRTRKRRANPAA